MIRMRVFADLIADLEADGGPPDPSTPLPAWLANLAQEFAELVRLAALQDAPGIRAEALALALLSIRLAEWADRRNPN